MGVKEYNAKYWAEHKEEISKRRKEFYKEHKEEIDARHQRWLDENRDHWNKYMRERRRKARLDEKEQA